jgi:arginase family enzyme
LNFVYAFLLHFVLILNHIPTSGADLVEVAPAYDQAEITSLAAAGIVADFLSMLQADAPPKPHVGPFFED